MKGGEKIEDKKFNNHYIKKSDYQKCFIGNCRGWIWFYTVKPGIYL